MESEYTSCIQESKTENMEQFSSNIKGVKELVDICREKGMEHVIVSPGSRNAFGISLQKIST